MNKQYFFSCFFNNRQALKRQRELLQTTNEKTVSGTGFEPV